MNCICCSSKKIEFNPLGLKGYATCKKCGVLFLTDYSNSNNRKLLLNHYQNEDPYRAVAFAKKNFFCSALEFLSFVITNSDKAILDIGCSHGHFLEYALKKGWKTSGVEIAKKPAESAKNRIGVANVFEGKLKEANFSENSFDAITIWDVLAIVDNPYDELKECYRLLKEGGKIGLRTRNVHFQKIAYMGYKHFMKIFSKIGLKEPYVFNKFCFSPQSIKILLSRVGFKNIQIDNSPLTIGDPYRHSHFSLPIEIIKAATDITSKMVSLISCGKVVIGPALLIWADKVKI